MLAQGFGPGFNGPLELVAVVHDAAQDGALNRVVTAVGAQPGVARVAPPVLIPSRHGSDVALINVYPTSAPRTRPRRTSSTTSARSPSRPRCQDRV